ncbi:MAG: TetR/AcrR family transcriptional regulator [Bacilli bacterium]|nr:TetR/AcrR family transcriptional regulator [Bacilli bacterium]
MGEIRQSSKSLKLCIEDSLFLLMEEKPFYQIKVEEICRKAFVGRTSFYRHYQTKEDVLLSAFIRMWQDWCEKHDVQERKKFTLDNAETYFTYNLSIKDRLDAMYKNKLDMILLKSFEECMKDESARHGYEARFYGYGLFGILKEWWSRGFKESPEEVSAILRTFYK